MTPYKLEDLVTFQEPLPGSLSDRRVIFINGPPRSGKDTLGQHLLKSFGTKVVKLAGGLKLSVLADFGLSLDIDPEMLDPIKDIPLPIFDGLSFREACIEKSEERTKPWRGNPWFGKLLVRNMCRFSDKHSVVTDSGFVDEALPVIEAVGANNCLLIRIHAPERGITFKGDSRSYIELPGVETHDLANNIPDDPSQFFAQADNIAREFLFGEECGHFVAFR